MLPTRLAKRTTRRSRQAITTTSARATHFLPSNATTDTGEFIDPKSFPTAKYCGHCHQEAHTQWRESAHSNSNRPSWYLRNVDLLKTEKGVEYTRHCEGCHDPIALLAGALTPRAARAQVAYDEDGITCSVCHSIQKVDTRGTGSYVLGVPAVLVDEEGKPITRPVSDAEILAHLDRHSKAVMKDFYHTSEFCSACHKAALPQLAERLQVAARDLVIRRVAGVVVCEAVAVCRSTSRTRFPPARPATCRARRWRRVTRARRRASWLRIAGWARTRSFRSSTDLTCRSGGSCEFLQNSVFNVDIFALEHGK